MSTSVIPLDEERAPATIYQVFAQMARDSSIDPARIAALMELQIKAEERNAEKEFNAAFSRLLPKLPRVVKRGKINLTKDGVSKGSIPFVTIEDLDAAIRPLYTAEGFTLSFLSEPCATGVIRVGVLRHSAGHSIRSTMQLPPDKGPGRNDLQALGSSMSYCDRYLTRGLFNIIAEGEDDDASKRDQITKQQIDSIEDLMHECSLSPAARSKLLEMFGIKSLADATKAIYPAIINMLIAKRNALGSKAK